MAFIKTNLVALICGAATLILLTVALMGVSRNKRVVEDMTKQAAIVGQLQGASRNAQNDDTIARAKNYAANFASMYEKALQVVYDLNRHKPLMDGIFPSSTSGTARLQFVAAYKAALAKLRTDVLRGGPAPTNEDVEAEKVNVQEQLKAERQAWGAAEQDVFGGGTPPPVGPVGPGAGPPGGVWPGGGAWGPPGSGPHPGPPGGFGPPGGGFGPPAGGANDPNMNEPKYNPELRATVRRAKSVRMYVDEDAFHITDVVRDVTAPEDDRLWYAQMTLWIQQDVAKALAELNEKAAQSAGGTASVTQLPVKRLESIRVAGYRLAGGAIVFPPSIGAGGGGGGANQVPRGFTRKVSGDDFDVVAFNVTVWVDQRVLPQVIDAITRQNLYQCFNISFDAVTPPPRMLFGDAPVIQARLQFEGSFARAIYKTLMPPGVVSQLTGGAEGTGSPAPAARPGPGPAAPAKPRRTGSEVE